MADGLVDFSQGANGLSAGDPNPVNWKDAAEVAALQQKFDYASITPTTQGEFVGELFVNGPAQVGLDIMRYGSSEIQGALGQFTSGGGHVVLRPDKVVMNPLTGEPSSGQWLPYSNSSPYSASQIEFYRKAFTNYDFFERVYIHELGHEVGLQDLRLGFTAYQWEAREFAILVRNRGF